MSEITPATNEATIPEQAPTIETSSIEEPTDTIELDQELLDKELEEELIIEDFTIDGICGVY